MRKIKIGLHVECPLLLFTFNQNWNELTNITSDLLNTVSMLCGVLICLTV